MPPFFKPPRETAAEKRTRQQAKRRARQALRCHWHRKAPRKPPKASDSPSLGLPKGQTRAEKKTKNDRAESAHIKGVHRQVFAASSRCAFCGETEAQSARRHGISRHEMHEHPPRSATRGLPLEQRFSTVISARSCNFCHRLATDNAIWPEFEDSTEGWLGGYVVRHRDGRVVAIKRALLTGTTNQWAGLSLEIIHPVETW